MTRKLLKFCGIGILFTIVFLACRADNEEISNPKDENSEFVSKSLWKEDEIYIKNVMKIYDTHEKEIQKKIGNPNWNYAMTFGNFDESFLKVPILKEDRVIGVLQVKRRKGNNKVYFNYDDNQNDINFFQTYIFDKRGKKPRENIIKLTGGENAKLAIVTCVTASFLVDCFTVETDCIPNVVTITSCTVWDDGTGGGESNEGNMGGYDYPPPPTGSGGNTGGTKDICGKAKAGTTKANTLLSDSRVKTDFTTNLKNIAFTSMTTETVITISKKDDFLDVSNPEVSSSASSGNVPSAPNGYTAIADGHNHNNSSPPSPGDLWGMLEILAQNSFYETRYIFGKDGSIYALIVNDLQAAKEFLVSHPRNLYLQPGKGDWILDQVSNPIYNEFKEAYGPYLTDASQEAQNKANAAALAYIMDKYNVGISLSKSDGTKLQTINSQKNSLNNYTSTKCN